ncbi:Membrane-associated phospholipid phosphatase [Frankineae bacterium MT45]|nr:Membrane-associated phospholipid phosphatase [Frankineae bacterium MT45]
MAQRGDASPTADGVSRPRRSPGVPSPIACVVLGICASSVIVASAWLATRPGAETAQTDLVVWFNAPPQPFGAILAVVNPLLRPFPLTLLGIALLAWIVLTARGRFMRLEIVRCAAVAYAIAQITATVLKHLANQPRPLFVVPNLDTHGYPGDPNGNAYPSAHTAVVVAIVAATWPWVRWPQRLVGVVVAVLIAFNRLYIGAHWPIDVVGGVAIGLLAAAIAWLIAQRWPMNVGARDGGRAL